MLNYFSSNVIYARYESTSARVFKHFRVRSTTSFSLLNVNNSRDNLR